MGQSFVQETFYKISNVEPIEEETETSKVVLLLIGVIGMLLIIFSTLLSWTTYSTYLQRK